MTQPLRAGARALLAGTAVLATTGVALSTAAAFAPPAAARSVAAVTRQADLAALPARQALDALRRGDWGTYTVIRGQVAGLVAPRAGLDPQQLDAVWRRTDARHMGALLAALSQLGVPYHRRASAPGQAFDCSGLTSWAWAQSGVLLPRQSGRQIRGAARVALDTVAPGDLLYYPGHVMLALGLGGAMVHAPNTGHVVEVRMLSARQQRRVRVGDPGPFAPTVPARHPVRVS